MKIRPGVWNPKLGPRQIGDDELNLPKLIEGGFVHAGIRQAIDRGFDHGGQVLLGEGRDVAGVRHGRRIERQRRTFPGKSFVSPGDVGPAEEISREGELLPD